ncbi:transposase [Tenacibaculum tangerinum]|uniref:Transposase n=1 Tax=Tenacibaculum tangerinum TaxID=3038772 RepID=A0ABY8LA94_9FLAO|nr:transposase [Tenacibaculum tangerinum]
MHCLGQCTGISFLDSTTIKVCHYKREKQNKVFKKHHKKRERNLG